MESAYICVACGVQFANSPAPPDACPICQDEREYIPARPQQWTTLTDLRREHRNVIQPLARGLMSITSEPPFAIAQQTILVQGAEGNVLWDCISLIDDRTVEALHALGGVTAIAVSHPHFYASAVEWSRALGGIPIYLHAKDRHWVMRPDPAIVHWEGDRLTLNSEMTLIHCAGHFDGASVLHWMDRTHGEGVLLTGDVIHILSDSQVTFMFSYPNHIPLPVDAIERITRAIEPFAFDRMYGCWPPLEIRSNAKTVVLRSAQQYIRDLNV